MSLGLQPQAEPDTRKALIPTYFRLPPPPGAQGPGSKLKDAEAPSFTPNHVCKTFNFQMSICTQEARFRQALCHRRGAGGLFYQRPSKIAALDSPGSQILAREHQPIHPALPPSCTKGVISSFLIPPEGFPLLMRLILTTGSSSVVDFSACCVRSV